MDEHKLYTSGDDGKIIFGNYPQSVVRDAQLTDRLNTLAGALPDENDPRSWTDYGYYIGGEPRSFTWYIDVEYDGERYRGVYFTQCRPACLSAPMAYLTPQTNSGYDVNTVYWFRWEPIVWRVLSDDGKKLFVVADKILDCMQINAKYWQEPFIRDSISSPAEYDKSDIRSWLNEAFLYTAFDEECRDIIMTTEVDNSVNSLGSESDQTCANTFDKIFLLSYREATDPDLGMIRHLGFYEPRNRIPTDYAVCLGLDTFFGGASWWLRSPSLDYYGETEKVLEGGSVSVYGTWVNYCDGIVPAMKILH